ncbi:MAG TPA: gluconeogenesis factor YvcK family protein [Polyangia bacterium]
MTVRRGGISDAALPVWTPAWVPPRSVTVIGGGTGSYNVLSGLRPFRQLRLTSIVTMADSGGDSGRLRTECNVLPPGDVRRCLVALSEADPLMRQLFSYRFEDEGLQGRHLGNLLVLALTRMLGSEQDAIDAAHQLLEVRGRVIPVSLDPVNLCAELSDGRLIEGEANIDVPKHDPVIPIKRVFLQPEAHANPEAIAALSASEVIVLAPGDLYTSTLPNLLVKGIPEAICESSARLIYILNLMTKRGETQGYSAARHVEEIVRYAGRAPNVVLVHDGDLPSAMAERYRAENAIPVEIDEPAIRALGVTRIAYRTVMSAASKARHDPDRTAAALLELFSEPTLSTATPILLEQSP